MQMKNCSVCWLHFLYQVGRRIKFAMSTDASIIYGGTCPFLPNLTQNLQNSMGKTKNIFSIPMFNGF